MEVAKRDREWADIQANVAMRKIKSRKRMKQRFGSLQMVAHQNIHSMKTRVGIAYCSQNSSYGISGQ